MDSPTTCTSTTRIRCGFRHNYSHQTNVGHELKSRANVNFIEYNRFSNEQNGSASREIDLPDGGQACAIGNVAARPARAEQQYDRLWPGEQEQSGAA
ncbi:MAG: hypothetical protein IPO56_17085 [Flavobacteriales bacterium]|nr:hypothetical protein [Flavobacteriales bacterium]